MIIKPSFFHLSTDLTWFFYMEGARLKDILIAATETKDIISLTYQPLQNIGWLLDLNWCEWFS